jgi:hypothetical protein
VVTTHVRGDEVHRGVTARVAAHVPAYCAKLMRSEAKLSQCVYVLMSRRDENTVTRFSTSSHGCDRGMSDSTMPVLQLTCLAHQDTQTRKHA